MAKVTLELPEEYDLLSITIIGSDRERLSVAYTAFDLEEGKEITYSKEEGWVQTKERSNHERSV